MLRSRKLSLYVYILIYRFLLYRFICRKQAFIMKLNWTLKTYQYMLGTRVFYLFIFFFYNADNRWTAYWFFFGSGGGVWKLSLGPVRANRERRNLVQSNQRSQGYLFQINQNSRLGLKCSYVKHQYVLNKNFVIDRIAEELKHLFIVFFSYVPKDLNTTTKGRTAQMELQNRNTWIRQSFLAANHVSNITLKVVVLFFTS